MVDGFCDAASDALSLPIPVLDGYIACLKGPLTNILPGIPLDDPAFVLELFGVGDQKVTAVSPIEA